MNITRRRFLGLAGLLPVIGKLAKDILSEQEPPQDELELELELEAWDKVSDDAWLEWADDVKPYDTGTLTVSDNRGEDDWWIVSGTNATVGSSLTNQENWGQRA